MSDVLVRGLSARAVQRLKERGRRNGRSLQGEAKRILEHAAGNENIVGLFERWDKQFAGRRFSSSAQIIREDRRR
jgi:hypothetical protein